MRVLFLEQTLAPLQVTAQLESTLSMTQNPNLVQLLVDGIVYGSAFGILLLLKNHYSSPFLKKSNLKRPDCWGSCEIAWEK